MDYCLALKKVKEDIERINLTISEIELKIKEYQNSKPYIDKQGRKNPLYLPSNRKTDIDFSFNNNYRPKHREKKYFPTYFNRKGEQIKKQTIAEEKNEFNKEYESYNIGLLKLKKPLETLKQEKVKKLEIAIEFECECEKRKYLEIGIENLTIEHNTKIKIEEIEQNTYKLLNELRYKEIIVYKKRGYKLKIIDKFSILYSKYKSIGYFENRMKFSEIVFPHIIEKLNINPKDWKIKDFNSKLYLTNLK